MKGLFFARPIEFRLETPADVLVQGDTLHGTMAMTNRGAAAKKKLRMEIGLAYGDFKKIKDNEPGGLTLIEQRALVKSTSLKPGQETLKEWNFALGSNCPITSKEGSLFLLYGHDVTKESAFSKIDLQVHLSPVLETLISGIENHFAFAAKSRSTAKGFTEVKFKPPASYPTLEEMTVLMRLSDDPGLELRFICRIKKFNRGTGKGLQIKTVEVKKVFPKEEYLLRGTQPNRVLFKEIVEGVLAKATPGRVEKK